MPNARRFAVLMNPLTLPRPSWITTWRICGARSAWRSWFRSAPRGRVRCRVRGHGAQRVDGVLVLADAAFYVHRLPLGELCAKHRLPSVWGGRGYLDGGGLASFQGDFAELFRRSASTVDKILNGTKPGDIPFGTIHQVRAGAQPEGGARAGAEGAAERAGQRGRGDRVSAAGVRKALAGIASLVLPRAHAQIVKAPSDVSACSASAALAPQLPLIAQAWSMGCATGLRRRARHRARARWAGGRTERLGPRLPAELAAT